MNRKKILGLILIVVVIVASLLGLLLWRNYNLKTNSSIESVIIKPENIEEILMLSGNYLLEKNNILSRVSGTIAYLHQGYFTSGDLLVGIESDDYNDQLKTINNKLLQAQLNIDKLKERLLSSRRDIDLARNNLEAGQDTLKTLEEKKISLEYKASFEGMVYESRYRIGDLVTPSIPAVSIYKSGSLYALVRVLEKDRSLVANATKIELTYPLLGDKIYQGALLEVSNLIELDNLGQRVLRVKIKTTTPLDIPLNSSVAIKFTGEGKEVTYNGYVDSDEKSVYTPRMSAEVVFIETAGKKVTPGTLLIKLHSDELNNQISQQKRTIIQLNANMTKAEEVASSLKLDQTILNLQYQELLQQEKTLLRQKQNFEITANFSGKVLQTNFEVGDQLTPGQLIMIVEKGRPFVRGYITEDEFTRVKIGQQAQIRFIEEVFSGEVVEISTIAQPGRDGSNVYHVKFELQETPIIPDNAGVDVNLIVQEKSQVLTLPIDSLVYIGQEEYVYVLTPINDNFKEITRVKVKIGIENDNRAEILEGLNAGDEVVINPDPDLSEGMRIKVTP